MQVYMVLSNYSCNTPMKYQVTKQLCTHNVFVVVNTTKSSFITNSAYFRDKKQKKKYENFCACTNSQTNVKLFLFAQKLGCSAIEIVPKGEL